MRYEEDIDTYMAREVLPHVPDAKAFFEENLGAKNPVIKTGAEIIFTRQFYAPSFPESSDTLEDEFVEMSKETGRKIKELFS